MSGPQSTPAAFLRVWLGGLLHPGRSFDLLREQPAPCWGVSAIAFRWLGSALTTGLLSWLLDRPAVAPSYLTFLQTGVHPLAWRGLTLAFGVNIWLLMSALAHLLVRLAGKASDFDRVLNIIGFGMLIPMPAVWLWDWTMLAFNTFQLPAMAISHTLFQIWETGLEALGLHRLLGIRWALAGVVALTINILFILLAMVFVR